jgi:MFS family permease
MAKSPPLRTLLLMPRILITVINYGFLSFCEMSIGALTPLMWSTSLEHGGLGFTPYTIGLAISVYGILSTIFQATVVGKVIRCFGPRKVFIGGFVPMLISISCFPLEGYLARQTGHADWRVWTVIIVHLAMYCLGTASYSKWHFLRMPNNIYYRQARCKF